MEIPFKMRLALILIGLIVGIPMSYNGLVLLQGKIATQQLNCIQDAYAANLTSKEAAQAAQNNLLDCTSSIDPRMGTIKFIREQHRRASQQSDQH